MRVVLAFSSPYHQESTFPKMSNYSLRAGCSPKMDADSGCHFGSVPTLGVCIHEDAHNQCSDAEHARMPSCAHRCLVKRECISTPKYHGLPSLVSYPLPSPQSAHGWLSTVLCIIISRSSSSQLSNMNLHQGFSTVC